MEIRLYINKNRNIIVLEKGKNIKKRGRHKKIDVKNKLSERCR